MKILYAADNNPHGKIQAERFLQNVDHAKFNIKVAAYRNYLPRHKVDWTLDCLLHTDYKQVYALLNNRYLDIYLDQVNKFKPDLIISDLEINTSYVAAMSNIRYWHVSNKLFNYALPRLYKKYVNLYKHYAVLYGNDIFFNKVNELINLAECNYIYSHWGDLADAPAITDNFKWIRPYHAIGFESVPCAHNYVAADINNNNKVLEALKNKDDCVLFTSGDEVIYDKIKVKNIYHQDEYNCNVANCNVFICDGNASYLADAIYNDKKIIIAPDINNKECMLNYLMYHKIYNYLNEGEIYLPPKLNINSDIKLLHQHLESP